MNDSNVSLVPSVFTSASICGWVKPPKVYCDYGICDLDNIAYPFLLFVATVGSFLNVIVFAKERPKVAKGVYLIVMASADCGYMWGGFLFYMKKKASDPSASFLQLVEDLHGFSWFMQEICSYTSDWILIAFTVDRFLAIKSPLHHRLINSPRKAWTIAGCVIMTACLSSLNRLVDYYWFHANDPGFGPLPIRPYGLKVWRTASSWFVVIVPTITFLSVLILNVLLGRILVCRKRQPLRQLSVQEFQTKPKSSSEQNAMILLASCVLLYLISQFPAIVYNILDILDMLCVRQKGRTFGTYERQMIAVKFFGLYLNYSLNFILYCAVSPTFRMQLINALRKCYTRHTGHSHRQSSTHSVRSWFPSLRRARSSGHPRERDGNSSSSGKEKSYLLK